MINLGTDGRPVLYQGSDLSVVPQSECWILLKGLVLHASREKLHDVPKHVILLQFSFSSFQKLGAILTRRLSKLEGDIVLRDLRPLFGVVLEPSGEGHKGVSNADIVASWSSILEFGESKVMNDAAPSIRRVEYNRGMDVVVSVVIVGGIVSKLDASDICISNF